MRLPADLVRRLDNLPIVEVVKVGVPADPHKRRRLLSILFSDSGRKGNGRD